MTIDEFNQQGWRANMMAGYKGDAYPIVSVDFGEKLVQLSGVVGGCDHEEDSYAWVRCESIILLNVLAHAPGANE